ncbi:MAG: hypothetical protein KDG89_04040 [Geminicoccaceae bacterium]|nr:hypothetical protein [Geminicoccaceae bacterium]
MRWFAVILQVGHFAPPPGVTPVASRARCAAAGGRERRLAALNVVLPSLPVRKRVNL